MQITRNAWKVFAENETLPCLLKTAESLSSMDVFFQWSSFMNFIAKYTLKFNCRLEAPPLILQVVGPRKVVARDS